MSHLKRFLFGSVLFLMRLLVLPFGCCLGLFPRLEHGGTP